MLVRVAETVDFIQPDVQDLPHIRAARPLLCGGKSLFHGRRIGMPLEARTGRAVCTPRLVRRRKSCAGLLCIRKAIAGLREVIYAGTFCLPSDMRMRRTHRHTRIDYRLQVRETH